MERKIDRRITKTKSSIRHAFIELMQKKAINQITVTELANNANIDRKTFYLHYETPMDVYKEIISDVSKELQKLLNEQEDFSFHNFFNGLNQIMDKDLKFYKIIAEKDSYSFLLNECVKLLNHKLSQKYLSEDSPSKLDLQIKIGFAASGIIGVYVDWLNDNKGISLDELAEVLSQNTEVLINNIDNKIS